MSDKKVSRREFLYLGAVATAGATLAACQPQTVVVEKEVTKVVEKEVEKTTKRENEKLVDDMFEDDESTSGDSEDGGDDEDVDYTSEFDDMFDD